jgi:hypothetical protein
VLVLEIGSNAKTGSLVNYMLLTDKDQNAGRQRQDPHYDSRDGDVKQQSDSDEYQVDGEQEHSEVFGDVHGFCLKQSPSFCTLKIGAEKSLRITAYHLDSRP